MRKANKTELSDTQKSVLFTFLSNLSILKVYNKEFLKSKSFYLRLFQMKFLVVIEKYATLTI